MRWPSTTPSFRTATPRTSRSRRRCSRWCRSSASPGTGAGRCGSFATTPACRRRRACGPRSSRRSGNRAFLILLASPEAAASQWVNKEVAYWLDHKGVDTLLIASPTASSPGTRRVGDFDRREGTPLPPVLAGRFPERAEMGGPDAPIATAPTSATPSSPSSPPTSLPPSTACRRRTCSRRRCASSAAR